MGEGGICPDSISGTSKGPKDQTHYSYLLKYYSSTTWVTLTLTCFKTLFITKLPIHNSTIYSTAYSDTSNHWYNWYGNVCLRTLSKDKRQSFRKSRAPRIRKLFKATSDNGFPIHCLCNMKKTLLLFSLYIFVLAFHIIIAAFVAQTPGWVCVEE